MPQRDQLTDVSSGAEALVRLLAVQGVSQIFLNPGTDTAPIQEAVVALRERGQRVPTIWLCPDERVALSAAHGYWMSTGTVQVVMVHVDVGTQGLGAALHNAQRDHAGVVIIAGRTPRTYDGEQLGGRSITVQWLQDQPDQVGIVRGFVKWAGDVASSGAFATLVPRAFQVASAAPSGPVYLTVAREVLMERMTQVREIPPSRRRAPVTPAADPAAVATAAGWLADAEWPVLITGRTGRDPGSVKELVALCDLIGLPVIDSREYLNLPSDHACYVRDAKRIAGVLERADLVLVIDSEVPWVPLVSAPSEDARVVQIDMDPVKLSMPSWGFSVDLPIQADSAKALPQLIEALRACETSRRRERWGARRAALQSAATDAHRYGRDTDVPGPPDATPVSAESAMTALNRSLPTRAVLLEEATTNDLVVREHIDRTEPGTCFAIGAAGLGWIMGAAIGVKLAKPEADVVAVCGDGSFMFCAPVAALWAAHSANAPFLTVILNNGGYRASKNPVVSLFPHGASARSGDFTGTVLGQELHYAEIAQACGAYGERVVRLDQLEGAYQRGFEATRRGQCAVVDIILPVI